MVLAGAFLKWVLCPVWRAAPRSKFLPVAWTVLRRKFQYSPFFAFWLEINEKIKQIGYSDIIWRKITEV